MRAPATTPSSITPAPEPTSDCERMCAARRDASAGQARQPAASRRAPPISAAATWRHGVSQPLLIATATKNDAPSRTKMPPATASRFWAIH